MSLPQKFPIARQSAGYAPLRRRGSIRRTTSIDSDWPEGREGPRQMIGRARDLLTDPDGEPHEFATGGFRITASPQREIMAIEVTPDHPRAQTLVGVRAGGGSRAALNEAIGDLRGSPTYQLLDDFPGASLVGAWVWGLWSDQSFSLAARRRMADICIGYAPGASSLLPDGTSDHVNHSRAEVGPLENPDDPAGWHVMPRQQGPQARRARRIDLWRENGLIQVDAGFQDSGINPAGGRCAVHEYRVHAEIDAASGVLVGLQALPLILPYAECPGASVKATRMIGQKVADFRKTVPEALASTLGCTHLNDVLRSLADVPLLARHLPAA